MVRLTPSIVAVLVLAAVASACTDEATTAASTSTSIASPTSSSGPIATPARERLEWLLGLINAPAPVADDEIAAGFTADFLAQIPVADIVAAVGGAVGTDTGWTVTDDAELAATAGTATITSSTGKQLTLQIEVESEGEHRIAGLQLVPVLPEPFAEGEAPTEAAISTKLAALGSRTAWGLFDADSSAEARCAPIAGSGVDTVQPIGSAFKLWVLGALATEIEAGRASWDEPLAVSEALRSSTDGEIAQLAEGTTRTLREFAEVMIAISDNSATDQLIVRLGRSTVEAAMVAAGVADPARNIPMLTTRELFLLKWAEVVPVDDYLALDAAGRRRVLDEQLTGIGLTEAISPDTDTRVPTLIDDVEWFASPVDLCRTHVWLAELATRPGLEPIAEILSANPGVPFEARWTDVRFKGGSEAGVLFGAWRIAGADGSPYVIAGGVADPDHGVDEFTAVVLLAAAASLAPAG